MEPLIELFERCFRVPPPEGMIPEEPLARVPDADLLYGSPAAARAPFLLQGGVEEFLAEAEEGYRLVGFWGHGINSHAFYFVRKDAWGSVFFRLPYGGVYMDNDRNAASIRRFLTQYFKLEPELRRRSRSLVAVDAMRMGRYRFELIDGRVIETRRSLLGAADLRECFAEVLSSPAR